MDPLLIFDVSYLAHRAFHSVGDLAHGDEGTGVVFGVLRDVLALQDRFQTGRCAFVFDHPAPKLRQTILPTYKSTRAKRYGEETEEDQERRRNMRRQVRLLHSEYLLEAGFRNVFAARGFEADDIIASITGGLGAMDEAIIVSSDQDLWQCVRLRPRVMCWNPHNNSIVNWSGFRCKWGIDPGKWAAVKAISGCKTDDVPGIKGVGEITAAKYLRGELKQHTKAFQDIWHNEDVWLANLALVKLPFAGTPKFNIHEDDITEKSWGDLVGRLGMKSLATMLPRGVAKTKKGRRRNAKGFF